MTNNTFKDASINRKKCGLLNGGSCFVVAFRATAEVNKRCGNHLAGLLAKSRQRFMPAKKPLRRQYPNQAKMRLNQSNKRPWPGHQAKSRWAVSNKAQYLIKTIVV